MAKKRKFEAIDYLNLIWSALRSITDVAKTLWYHPFWLLGLEKNNT